MSGGNRNHGHGGDAVLKKILRSKRGEGYLDVCILVLCAMLVIALAVRIFPVFAQACMSFTSQNYAVGKQKRMDRVLIDCLFLTTAVALVMGSASYIFGTQILGIYTSNSEVIKSGLEIISITTIPYFLCGIMDLFPGALRGMGYSTVPMILSIIGTVGVRIIWIYGLFPSHRSLFFLFISYPGSWIATIIMQAICYMFVRNNVKATIGVRKL